MGAGCSGQVRSAPAFLMPTLEDTVPVTDETYDDYDAIEPFGRGK
ncbi:hypothetical protein [Microcoleus sp. FACHB-1515]|nr:hypothetical protein [Microcoleus sp. FACHB-1515]